MGEKIRLRAFFASTLDWDYVVSFVLRRLESSVRKTGGTERWSECRSKAKNPADSRIEPLASILSL